MMSICFGFRKRGHAGESSSRLMGPNRKPHICPKRMEQRRKMVYRNKRPRPSRRSSLQRFRWTLSTWKQEKLRFIKLPMRRQTRVHCRCLCVLTVRKTDASSRTTEYTSPLLLIKTCVGRKKKTSRSHNPATGPGTERRWLTEDPWSTRRVRKAQGNPRPNRMSKILLPMELDTAMSPMPDKEWDKQNQTSQQVPSAEGGEAAYLAELQSDWPCSPERWFPRPGRWCPWCNLGCLACDW